LLYPLSYEGNAACDPTAGTVRRARKRPVYHAAMAPATVLVVDDDPVILKLLEVNFEMEGFQVVRASDGAEGLERARAVLPDIVVLDVMMPRMTGYEVAKALREDDGTAHIPIIFVTARAQSSDVERGMELGVDDYVTKPFDPLDLIARVNTLLARSQVGAEPMTEPLVSEPQAETNSETNSEIAPVLGPVPGSSDGLDGHPHPHPHPHTH
jgi:DNA-binding response OmpR family regulator